MLAESGLPWGRLIQNIHLTRHAALAKGGPMQKTLFSTAAALALLSLAACNNEPETVSTRGADPQAEQLKTAPKVELPPAIAASRTYRCKDNSLVYIDFYTNNTATFRTEQGGTATTLTAAEAGQPYTAEGHSVSANAANITLTAPGKGTLSCKA
jgi:uncharacterized protein (DUF2345 family)